MVGKENGREKAPVWLQTSVLIWKKTAIVHVNMPRQPAQIQDVDLKKQMSDPMLG